MPSKAASKSSQPAGLPSRPTLLLMCGLPASGKSTFSKELGVEPEDVARKLPSWLRVSPDDIGSVENCKKLIAKQLKAGASVVVDRCNASHKERQMFVREAKAVNPDTNVEVLFFRVPPDVCIARAKARRNHPTLDPNEAEKVIGQFSATFRPPESVKEGPYTAIHTVDENTDARDLRALLLHFREVGVRGPFPFTPAAAAAA